METENLATRLEGLERELSEVKQQTGFVDHHALNVEERERLRVLCDTSETESKETLKRFIPLFKNWRKRGEIAEAKLPDPGNFVDVTRGLDNLLKNFEHISSELPETWEGIAAMLSADDALEHLAAIRLRINRARSEVSGITIMRDGIRGLIAKLETVATLNEE